MASIAHDAGVGVGTVYRHFPARADLLAALERRSYTIVLDTARAVLAQPLPHVSNWDELARRQGLASTQIAIVATPTSSSDALMICT